MGCDQLSRSVAVFIDKKWEIALYVYIESWVHKTYHNKVPLEGLALLPLRNDHLTFMVIFHSSNMQSFYTA